MECAENMLMGQYQRSDLLSRVMGEYIRQGHRGDSVFTPGPERSRTHEETLPACGTNLGRRCLGNMRGLHKLLVCCCVWWVGAARRLDCMLDWDAMLDLSTETSSLSEGNEDIHRRSLSPWTWRMSAVPTRIPATIWEAECSSSSVCLFADVKGETERQTGDGTEGLSAVPIYQDVLVLQRKPGSKCFISSFRRVAVGCTCVRALSDTSSHLS